VIVKLVAVAAAVTVALSGLASAHHVDVTDPDDVDGVLDLRRVSLYGKPPVWSLKTRRPWRARTIWDRGFLLVALDTFGSARYDYYALIRSDGRRLRAALWRDRSRKKDYRVTWLKTWRPDRRRVKVRLPLRTMTFGKRRRFYRWYSQTLLTGPDCRRTCIDVAPDRSGVREPLRPPPDESRLRPGR
jgi:hypothetical protein